MIMIWIFSSFAFLEHEKKGDEIFQSVISLLPNVVCNSHISRATITLSCLITTRCFFQKRVRFDHRICFGSSPPISIAPICFDDVFIGCINALFLLEEHATALARHCFKMDKPSFVAKGDSLIVIGFARP
mmetsp:Transcript_26483/g.39326  ORF Transcript_26483/g.39326 Transcript_26483/m.39326 type:complete len:130 (-) Transcript_26483:137-526(-)